LQTGAELLIWSAWGLFLVPLTVRFAGRYGNRPFLLAGLVLNTASLAALAVVAREHTSYLTLAPLLALSGIGISMVFPTVTGEAIGAVDPSQVGIASGTNNALRELGGVFGIAVLATVFNRPGVYTSPQTFVDGFRSAIWVAVAFTAIGIVLTVFLNGPRRSDEDPAGAVVGVAQPELS
jgi:MFS family permease